MRNKKGFTLAELLIVVAVIGVLVAISIPIFTMQLRKARLAVNQANARAAYAAAMAEMIENPDRIGFGNGNNSYSSFCYDLSTGKAELVTTKSWSTSNEDYLTYLGSKKGKNYPQISEWKIDTKGEQDTCLSDKVYTKWKIDIANGQTVSATNTAKESVGGLYAICWQK